MADLKSILVTPESAEILGGPLQFTAYGIYPNGSSADVTAQCVWQSSDEAVATVDAAGLATGAAAGVATITASSGSVAGSATLAVNVALVSISVAPTGATITAKQTIQFAATGNYSDSSQVDLTDSVAWLSSNLAVAQIDAAGLATGVAAGAAAIVARAGDRAGLTQLTVMAAAAPPTVCDQLAAARRQMYLLLTGQSVVSVETPLLGRVEYSKANAADLQRVIDSLAAECAAAGGSPGTASGRRKPFSLEVWP